MTNEAPKFRDGFAGIVITGWQRYDHFAVLCELLPAAIPSLALSLAATTHGYFNMSLRPGLHAALRCPPIHPARQNIPSAFLNLNNDPYLWDRFSGCAFPGVASFRLMARLDSAETDIEEFLTTTTKKKGWLTEYNIKHNYTSPLRIDELMGDHSRLLHTMLALARSAKDALGEAFDSHTIGEWIEQKILPYVKKLEQLQKDTDVLKEKRIWPIRPLPLDTSLRRLGIEVPVVDRKDEHIHSSRGRK
jgi:hexosaminidase